MTVRLRAVHRDLRDRRAFVACLVGTWLLTAAIHHYVIPRQASSPPSPPDSE